MSNNQNKRRVWKKANIEISSCIHHKQIINKNDNKENQTNTTHKTRKEKKTPMKNQVVCNIRENSKHDSFKDCLTDKVITHRKPLKEINIVNDDLEELEVKNNKYVYEPIVSTKPTKKAEACNLPDIPEERLWEISESINPVLMQIYDEFNPPMRKFERITVERDFDFLNMTDLSLEHRSDESFLFEDISGDSKSSLSNPFFTTNLNSSDHIKKTCTPANTFIPQTQITAIKKIRRAVLKVTCPESNVDLEDTILQELVSKKLRLDCNATSVNTYEEIQRDKMKSRIYDLAGAVNLDSQENFVYHSVLYSTPYLNYIFEHQRRREYEYRLSSTFLKKFSVTNLNRSIVINWLIKLQAYMKTEHVSVHTAVRMMDRTLDQIDIPLNMLQLVALASFWISLKFHAVHQKEVSWMVKQSDGAYTNDQLIMMERQVFQANNFKVNSVDQSIYIHYYTLNLQTINPDIIAQCSHFILDCALLDCQFIHTLPSMMAAAAVYTTLKLLKQYNEKAWLRLLVYKGFYTPKELESIKLSFVEMLKEMNDPSFQCREPYKKFSTARFYNVANIIMEALEKY